MNTTLKDIITPSLLDLMVEYRVPFPTDQPLNFADVAGAFFSAGDSQSQARFKDAAWPPLLSLSRIGLDGMPDLMQFLPPPSAPTFPKQCLGLQILVDQAPRVLFKGVDKRWQTGYFDVISQRLAATWLALAENERPDSQKRWTQEIGVTLDWWICARLWFAAPFVHSESVKNQSIALELTGGTRRVVEAASGTQDPWRAKREEVLSDLYGFPRVVKAGPPPGPDVTRETWCWWYTMLMDIHKPIIDKFGRYPYNNAAQGRESTDEELEWLEQVDHFAEAPLEVAKLIKADVAAGIWQELGAGTAS
ncbi:unnamed protein product [Discula destructiva]